ncbi:Phosphatidylglycerol/phosphatidylinositol transfer protein [Smittium culicis]|uniref:Phosphatidylglycerol/phosphatidylinositol transfer protein n=1 Tax=Smittium culicis TaxID=133412 RepID=A0A1R1YB50_9FUNG|nr:Phosphatidylglycerol/phosphatidylinositol transfer protein [Smittium culicis]
MKLILLVLIINSALAIALSVGNFFNQVKPQVLKLGNAILSPNPVKVADSKSVPLNEIITDESDTDDLMDIISVTLDPSYPKRGINISIEGKADIKETIESASAHLLEENSDIRCPIAPGVHEIKVNASLSSFIPPGWFTVVATAKRDADEKQIGKVVALVKF